MKRYFAIFNEPGDFDDFGIFEDEGEYQRLIAMGSVYALLASYDPSRVESWLKRDIRYHEDGDGVETFYAYIRKTPEFDHLIPGIMEGLDKTIP